MRPTTADDNVFDFNALLHPGTVFEHPREVVCHSGLTTAEKRGNSRLMGVGRICDSVPIHALTCRTEEAGVNRRDPQALCDLDGGPRTPPGGKPYRLRSTERAIAA